LQYFVIVEVVSNTQSVFSGAVIPVFSNYQVHPTGFPEFLKQPECLEKYN